MNVSQSWIENTLKGGLTQPPIQVTGMIDRDDRMGAKIKSQRFQTKPQCSRYRNIKPFSNIAIHYRVEMFRYPGFGYISYSEMPGQFR